MTVTQRHREKAAWAIYGAGWVNIVGIKAWLTTGETPTGTLRSFERMAEVIALEFAAGVEEGAARARGSLKAYSDSSLEELDEEIHREIWGQ